MTKKRIIKIVKILAVVGVLLFLSLVAYWYWYNYIKKYYCSFDVLDMYHLSVEATAPDIGLDYIFIRKIVLTDKKGNSLPIELGDSKHLGVVVKHDTIGLKGRRVPILLIHNVDYFGFYQALDMNNMVILKDDELNAIIGDPHMYKGTTGITYDNCNYDQ